MSICQSGFDFKPHEGKITITVQQTHPLLQLTSMLDWNSLVEIVLPDLKSTTAGGKWWLGRKLKLRIHLAVYILQQMYNFNDRQMETFVKDNAAFQIFCGKQIVKDWHFPDHTKIEEFRSRLSAETQKNLANNIASQSVSLGFADPRDIDIDSTIQEANMTYPSDATLLCKLATKVKTVVNYLNHNVTPFSTVKPMEINLKKIKSIARRYLFTSRNTEPDKKNNLFKYLFDCVKSEIGLAIENMRCLVPCDYIKSPWNILKSFKQIIGLAPKYLNDVEQFIKTGKMVPDKLLSFHLKDVKCFANKKAGDKKYNFGRRFQLGRITGNFVFVGKCSNTEMNDKHSITTMMHTHNKVFGTIVESVATDKGYYSKRNEKVLKYNNVKLIGMQKPRTVKASEIEKLPIDEQESLINRRAGIEPLIGHIKSGGQLNRSRMKSDKAIEASGYSAVFGFNLRQLIRHNTEKIKREAA